MVLKVIDLFDQAPASLQAYYGRLRKGRPSRRAKAAQKRAASEKGVPPTLPARRAVASNVRRLVPLRVLGGETFLTTRTTKGREDTKRYKPKQKSGRNA